MKKTEIKFFDLDGNEKQSDPDALFDNAAKPQKKKWLKNDGQEPVELVKPSNYKPSNLLPPRSPSPAE